MVPEWQACHLSLLKSTTVQWGHSFLHWLLKHPLQKNWIQRSSALTDPPSSLSPDCLQPTLSHPRTPPLHNPKCLLTSLRYASNRKDPVAGLANVPYVMFATPYRTPGPAVWPLDWVPSELQVIHLVGCYYHPSQLNNLCSERRDPRK